MSSFPAEARRVRDDRSSPADRLLALRECVLRFAPYGFRATWHHLILSAGIPRRLADDPHSLNRAIDELEQARHLWMAHYAAYTLRRRSEKAAGKRTPRPGDAWYSWAGYLGYCPDPERHPDERLVVVFARLIEAYGSGTQPPARCPACGTDRPSAETCTACGVDSRGPTAPLPPETRIRTAYRWRQIWRRATAPRPGATPAVPER